MGFLDQEWPYLLKQTKILNLGIIVIDPLISTVYWVKSCFTRKIFLVEITSNYLRLWCGLRYNWQFHCRQHTLWANVLWFHNLSERGNPLHIWNCKYKINHALYSTFAIISLQIAALWDKKAIIRLTSPLKFGTI